MGRRRDRQGAAGSEQRAGTARSEHNGGVSPIWIIPVVAVLAGLAVAFALGRQLADEARQLGGSLSRLGELGPELSGLRDGVQDLAATVARASRR